MDLEDLLKEVVEKFEKIKVPYAFTGAIGSSYWGRPRTTHDFDLVLHLKAGQNKSKKIIDVFHDDYYASEEAIISSIIHKTMFNLIHHQTGIKIDCWILKEDKYFLESFKRRKKQKFEGKWIYFLAPEDLILNKLLWYKESKLRKQIEDVRGILEVQRGKLDLKYLNKWASKLKVDTIIKLN